MQMVMAQPHVWTNLRVHEALCQTHLLKGQLAWYSMASFFEKQIRLIL